jgi:hypothetical protein
MTMRFINPFDEEVERRVTAAFEAEGYVVKIDESVGRNTKARNEIALTAFSGKEATSKLDKSANAITPGELYEFVFPHGPGADGDVESLEPEDRATYEQLKRDLWSLTQPKPEGWIQRRLASEGSTLVLCRAKVMRGADPVTAAYVTDDPTLIMEDSVSGEVEALVRKADNLRKHVDMLLLRHPELESRVLAELGKGVKRAQAALPSKVDSNKKAAA